MSNSLFKEKNNKYLLACWLIGLKYIKFIFKILSLSVKNIRFVSGYELEVEVFYKDVYPLLTFFKMHSLAQFNCLVDLIAYDSLKQPFRYVLVYNLLSVKFNFRIRVVTKLKEFDSVLSSISLFNCANWLEREVWDFYGIFFLLHVDLRKILTDYGFKGFALRKDFPLMGYVSLVYDDNQKKIVYLNCNAAQEYRIFSLTK